MQTRNVLGRYLSCLLCFLILSAPLNDAYAKYFPVQNCVLSNKVVPFQEITLNPNCSFQANYVFNDNPIIFCFLNTTDNVNVGQVTWTYQGKVKSGVLPIFLTNNINFQGELADSTGTITISNNISTAFIVNCLYGF